MIIPIISISNNTHESGKSILDKVGNRGFVPQIALDFTCGYPELKGLLKEENTF